MKLINKYILTLVSCTLMFCSCSEDWLVTKPTSSEAKESIFESTTNAKLAINGINKIMIAQHPAYGQSFNGEGTMKLLYGEYPGQDFNFIYLAPGWSPLMNNQITTNDKSIYTSYPWYYYYMIVANANSIIANVDGNKDMKGSQAEKDFIKAEALVYRAYSFTRLSTVYCDSWAKSSNGSTPGIILRLDESTGKAPLSTLAETYEQIYKDLDESIELFKSSGLTRQEMYKKAASSFPYPDINVAYALYARAALNKQDYSNALKYAKLARKDYSLMSVEDYRSGFCKPNNTSEWIWGVYNEASETIYYFGWQLFMASNGYYANNGINICANRELIEKFPETDIRKGLFLTESTFLSDGEKFEDVVATTDGSTFGKFATQKAYDKANAYVKSIRPTDPEQTYSYASLKFNATGQPAVGCIPVIRASEMVLIEAEANYFLNNPEDAKANLVELNVSSKRDPQYSCSKSGEELLKEIKDYRRLELWGEGFSWFDCKRWGDLVVRPSLEDGGNYISYTSGTYGENEEYWKWVIPEDETQYNEDLQPKKDAE